MTEPVETQETEKKPGLNWVTVLPVALFGVLVLLFFVGLKDAGKSRVLPSVLIGKPAPEFDLPPIEGLVLDGKKIPGLKLSDLKQGGVTLVNFWASWCIPCRQEHAQLIELGKMSGFKLVGINYKNKTADARPFLEQLGLPYKAVGADLKGGVGIDFGVVGVPETFLIDGKGIIRYKFIGPISRKAMMEDLLPKIREISGKSAK